MKNIKKSKKSTNKNVGDVTQWDDEMLDCPAGSPVNFDEAEDLQKDCCDDDLHLKILINKKGLPQCLLCLKRFDGWQSVQVALEMVYGGNDNKKRLIYERIRQLEKVSEQVIVGRPPENAIDLQWGRHLTDYGYRDIHIIFYDYDFD